MPATTSGRSSARNQAGGGTATKLALRGQSTDALLKKLKTIQLALEQDQDLAELGSSVIKELCSKDLTLHKDKAVRSSVACCLADVLRLSAPDAPYTEQQLQDIFGLFLYELTSPKSGLANPKGTEYADYLSLIESISNAKSIALVADLPKADDMTVEWFKKVYAIVGPNVAQNALIHLSDVLSQLLEECRSVPADVLELLLANFSPRAAKMNPQAHNLTAQVCGAASAKLQSVIAQYFSEAIVSASGEEDVEAREKELRNIHTVIAHINRTVPALLLYVMAVLEQELVAEDQSVRHVATRTLGRMFAEPNSRGLAAKYPSTWKAWLGRAKDRIVIVRVTWVGSISGVLAFHAELRADLSPVLIEKNSDPDERVRTALVKVIGGLDYETVLHHLDKAFLTKLSERLLDRRLSVRIEAQEAFGRLFDLAYPEIDAHDPAATKHFAWIPKTMLHTIYSESPTIVPLINTFEKHVLPLPTRPEDEANWTNRLLLVMKHLDEKATRALFTRLNNMQTTHSRKPYIAFIEACEAYNGGTIEADKEPHVMAKLKASIRGCAALMASFEVAASDLTTFAKMNDSRIFRLFQTCLNPSTDLPTYIKTRAEALRRVQAAAEDLVPTMTALLQLGSYPFLNRNSIPTLLLRLSRDQSQWRESQIGSQAGSSAMSVASDSSFPSSSQAGSRAVLGHMSDKEAYRVCAARALEFITRWAPEMYYPSLGAMIKAAIEPATPLATESILKALCAVQASRRQVTLDRRAIDRICSFIRTGTQFQAKYGARLLALCAKDNPSAERAVDELLSELSGRLKTARPTQLVSDLSALGQFFKHAPKASENVWDDVVRVVLEDLSRSWPEDANESASTMSDDEWIDDDQVEDAAKAKLLGLDVLCKRGIASTSDDAEQVADMIIPVFRLLFRTLEEGEPRKLSTPPVVKSRLRLQAAICILRLAMIPACDRIIQRDFVNLALVVQDSCFQVRSRFLHKLLVYLTGAGSRRRLATRYNAIPFMVAADPEKENRSMVLTWAARSKALPPEERLKRYELTFCRYVHLLSQHPDFKRHEAHTIGEFVSYVQFYLDCAASEQNLGLLFYLAGRLKTVRDGTSQGASENLYALSELTQLVIKQRASKLNWRLEQFPGSFKVPSDTGLKALPSAEAQKKIYEHEWLDEAAKHEVERHFSKGEKRRVGGPAAELGAASTATAEAKERERKRKAAGGGGGGGGGGADGNGKAQAQAQAGKRSKKARKSRKGGRSDEDASVSSDTDMEDLELEERSDGGGGEGEGDDDDEEEEAGERASDVSSDEDVSEGEGEGRGFRAKAAARERNRKRAARREAAAARRGGGAGGGAGAGAGDGTGRKKRK